MLSGAIVATAANVSGIEERVAGGVQLEQNVHTARFTA